MKFWISLFIVFHITLAGKAAKSTQILADSAPDPCKPENDDDIASSDELVNHMFEAYKKQATSESPPADHATTLTDVNAHEMVARLFLFLDKHLRKAEGKPGHEPLDSTAKYLFHLVHTDNSRWSDERKWPYRCFNVETVRALDTFLVGAMKSISQNAIQDELESGMLLFSMYMHLPQFSAYIKSLAKTPLERLCPIVHSSANQQETLRWLTMMMEQMSSVAETACQPPYESDVFCKMPALVEDLDSMHADYKRAGSSNEMKLFAFFWFLAPGLSNTCDDAFKMELSGSVLNPLAASAIARLDEVIKLSSTTGADLEKIRTFIYDYIFNYFTIYATSQVKKPYLTKAPFSSSESPESKYNKITLRKNIHPKPEKDFLVCFKTFIATLNDMEVALVNGADISEIHALARTALFWFLHPDFHFDSNEHYDSILDGLSYNMDHTDSLIRLGHAVAHYRKSFCTSNQQSDYVKFCGLYDVLRDFDNYATTLQDSPTTKILHPSSGSKKILELSTMRSMHTDIAALEIGQEQLEQSLFSMRSSLGSHFYQLATFDQDKAEYDVGFLQGRLNDFTKRIRDSGLEDDLRTLLKWGIGANTAEMAQLATQLAAALAENMNPLKWLTGGGGLQDVLDQVNALAQAGVNTAKLITLSEKVLPKIAEKVDLLAEAMATNTEVHRKLNITFYQLKDAETIDIDTVQDNFLMDYKNYDPGMSAADITDYTSLLKDAIDQLCEVIEAGDTAASAGVEIAAVVKNVCPEAKVKADVIEAVYLEMYDFQFDFMESMAAAVKALITKHSANTVRNVPEKEDDEETYRLMLKFYTQRIKLQSKQHILLALKSVCDADEYKNGGVPTDKCRKALESHAFPDIDRVIGHSVNECPSDQTNVFDVRFPARLNPGKDSLDPGVLDLTKLYSGELTPFKIPHSRSSYSWIQKFVSYSVPIHDDVALYLKGFEIFLPDLTENVQHDITVKVKQDGLMKVAPGGAIKYGFSSPKEFNLVYGENKISCSNGKEDSLYPELCPPKPSQICVASRGVVSENEISPPLYSDWLVQFILPRDTPAPKPSSQAPFYLRGRLTVCYKNPKEIDLSQLPRPSISSSGVSEDRCCPAGQYWYVSEFSATAQGCNDCPPGSTPKLGGLYCHDNSSPEGHRDKKHKNHRKAKSFFHRGSKKHKILNKKIQEKQREKSQSQ